MGICEYYCDMIRYLADFCFGGYTLFYLEPILVKETILRRQAQSVIVPVEFGSITGYSKINALMLLIPYRMKIYMELNLATCPNWSNSHGIEYKRIFIFKFQSY